MSVTSIILSLIVCAAVFFFLLPSELCCQQGLGNSVEVESTLVLVAHYARIPESYRSTLQQCDLRLLEQTLKCRLPRYVCLRLVSIKLRDHPFLLCRLECVLCLIDERLWNDKLDFPLLPSLKSNVVLQERAAHHGSEE